MVSDLRQSYNSAFSREKYQAFLNDLNDGYPGAIDFRAKKDEIATLLGDNKDKLVVAYCGGPTCSAYKAGASAAEAAGFKNIKHLSAGLSGWLQAGKETEKPKS